MEQMGKSSTNSVCPLKSQSTKVLMLLYRSSIKKDPRGVEHLIMHFNVSVLDIQLYGLMLTSSRSKVP